MPDRSLRSFLAGLIAESLSADRPEPRRRLGAFPETARNIEQDAAAIADELIAEAVAQGLPAHGYKIDQAPLGGGNTAELVARIVVHMPFAFKLDRNVAKLAEEALAMRAIRDRKDLPARFRDAWPRIHAVRARSPFAYLMEYFPAEDGWKSLEDRLFPTDGTAPVTDTEALRLVQAILDLLFEGYAASVDRRSLPSLEEDYVGRIRARLEEAAGLDARFESRPLSINGISYRPWRDYLSLIAEQGDFIRSIAPPFGTVAHGDPNPGNIMLRASLSGVEIKLIDPKEWRTGDYLFDLVKLTHFLEGTGPVEKPLGNPPSHRWEESEGDAALAYDLDRPEWVELLVAACRERIGSFAEAQGDRHWQARYELGMAANLLGLPAGRLKHKTNPRPQAALLLFAEGLKWLARFCARMDGTPDAVGPAEGVTALEVEPEPIARARGIVRETAPDCREGLDRKGFQVLRWDPIRPGLAERDPELSLEHEARLKPRSGEVLRALQQALAAAEGEAIGGRLVDEGGALGELRLRRRERGRGLQSIDRYYELSGEAGAGLIAAGLSLRERKQSRSFMTWVPAAEAAATGQDEAVAPLNLELPSVQVGGHGVTVRLEFNWVESLEAAVTDYRSTTPDPRNPLQLAAMIAGFGPAAVEPVIEHSTYREKYDLFAPKAAEGQARLFEINIDHVVAQSLRTGRIASYTDVDVAASVRVDDERLAALDALARLLSRRWELEPVGMTKVGRDASLLGESF